MNLKSRLGRSRKGQGFGFEYVPQVVISLGIAVFSLTLIIILVTTFQNTFVTGAANCNATNTDACGFAYNATQGGLEGLDEYNNWWVILVISSVFLIVFGLLAVIRSRTTML